MNENVYGSEERDEVGELEQQQSEIRKEESVKEVVDPFAAQNDINYDRYDNKYFKEFDSYFRSNFGYLKELEEKLKIDFKQMMNVDEVNVFFDLEMQKNLNDVGFYLNFEQFNGKEDPPRVKELISECVEILNSNKTNLEVDIKTIEQVFFISFIYLRNIYIYNKITFLLNFNITLDIFKENFYYY